MRFGRRATVINLQQSPVVQASPGGLPQGVTITPEMSGPSTAPTGGPDPTRPSPSARMPAHHHHGLLGRRHCVECQRARAKAADGVDIPPPPGYPGAQAMAPGETIVSGPVVVSERIVIGRGDPHAPGYAVVGGQETAAPGYAVVNGQGPNSDPTPIGLARGGQAMSPVIPAWPARCRAPGAGPYDPAVMQSSIPPPPTGDGRSGHDRPHIISHIFGLPKLGRHHEERVEQQARGARGDRLWRFRSEGHRPAGLGGLQPEVIRPISAMTRCNGMSRDAARHRSISCR